MLHKYQILIQIIKQLQDNFHNVELQLKTLMQVIFKIIIQYISAIFSRILVNLDNLIVNLVAKQSNKHNLLNHLNLETNRYNFQIINNLQIIIHNLQIIIHNLLHLLLNLDKYVLLEANLKVNVLLILNQVDQHVQIL